MIVGIDGSRCKSGGAIAHLIGILKFENIFPKIKVSLFFEIRITYNIQNISIQIHIFNYCYLIAI